MSRNYCMIIGDIIDSKNISEDKRYEIQNALHSELERINYVYDRVICSRFTITLGDELQGGLLNTIYLLEIINRIKRVIEPYKIRFGIGIGELRTYVKFENSFGTDGPAYYYARKGINELKQLTTYEYGYRIYTDNDCSMINCLFDALDTLSSLWTPSQKKYINFVSGTNGNLSAISKLLDIDASTLSRTLKRARYNQIKEWLNKIREYLYSNYDLSNNQTEFALSYNKSCKLIDELQYNEAVKVLKNSNPEDFFDKINCNINLSLCYNYIGIYPKSLEYAENSLGYLKENDNIDDYTYKKMRIYNYMGISYMYIKEYALSDDCFQKVLSYTADSKAKYRSYSIYAMGNLALLNEVEGNYEKAMEIYKELHEEITKYCKNDKKFIIKTNYHIGNLYVEMEDYDSAYDKLTECNSDASVYLSPQNTLVATIKTNLAGVIIEKYKDCEDEEEQYLKAENLLEDALKIYKKVKVKGNIKRVYKNFIKLYENTGDKLNYRHYSNLLNEEVNG